MTQPVKITETCLRDAHQSLLATRMRTEDMLPIAEKLDTVGYHSLEVWGGATFDSCLRYLKEDPWERLRQLREALPKTPLQMLLRGQNIVGYKHYPDDIVEKFIIRAKENGIDIFRIFDALNDFRNMEFAMKIVNREGGHVQASFCYTLSPLDSIDGFVKKGVKLEEMGADSVCIKDMSGLISPYQAYELVTELKAALSVPVQFHTHATSGMASSACLKAAEAGVDVIDTAISSLASQTSQPPTESLVASLDESPRKTGLDLRTLADIALYFADIRKRYSAFESGLHGVDIRVLTYQIPGGMLSNLVSQLREQNAEDRFEDVIQEVPRVRKELGYPPLVTPSSQIVGTQATLNVVLGERYKMIPNEVKQYVKGFYGRPPGQIDKTVKRLVIGEEEPITCRPADLLEPGFEKAREEIGDLARSEEDVLSYALFPQVAKEYFEWRAKGGGLEDAVAALAYILAMKKKPERIESPTYASPWKMAFRPRGGWSPW
ncbi:MAG: pyruvate/oxaloacetate carboxyltransferase [Theionarchaea archaeon]|nr:pyruvate/oxaloacetate carboxyltransferase [Theionarchaea archaeon]MBU7036724.1 pyruvate/oxaloacetate carboxyltransferase [Theionarchaea archaeon]